MVKGETMGYTTEFEGEFTIDRPVNEETYRLLVGLANTRRMARRVDAKYGIEGEFYIGGSGAFGQGDEPNIIDHNRPPKTQPGLWCQWLIQEDRQTIMWDGEEKFYEYTAWIEYLIDRILKPRGYVVNGEVMWRGEDFLDVGRLVVRDNVVAEVYH